MCGPRVRASRFAAKDRPHGRRAPEADGPGRRGVSHRRENTSHSQESTPASAGVRQPVERSARSRGRCKGYSKMTVDVASKTMRMVPTRAPSHDTSALSHGAYHRPVKTCVPVMPAG